MAEVLSRAPSNRTRNVLVGVAVVAVVGVAIAVQDLSQDEPRYVGVLAFGTDPTVRVDQGRYTYTTRLRSLTTETLTLEQLVPLRRDGRPATRAFVRVAGEADPTATNGEYAPTNVDIRLGPGSDILLTIVGAPDCPDVEQVIGVRVVFRRRAAEDAAIVAPPRVADSNLDLLRLPQRACE